ncbi:hypothetical protein VP01_666g5 [Puccinia sorghi]|uniref:Uncharacterized protein n=1 Tax=Puccinia sorghi TaxID=27349 RepID=A0A0L6UH22_9BASI|nr:hypothetical protein VP01_666g5 [Puccinia sorghi]
MNCLVHYEGIGINHLPSKNLVMQLFLASMALTFICPHQIIFLHMKSTSLHFFKTGPQLPHSKCWVHPCSPGPPPNHSSKISLNFCKIVCTHVQETLTQVGSLVSNYLIPSFLFKKFIFCFLHSNQSGHEIFTTQSMLNLVIKQDPTLQKKIIAQLPAVDMQDASTKLPSKLHMFSYVYILAQSLCILHSDCASKLGGITLGECASHHNFFIKYFNNLEAAYFLLYITAEALEYLDHIFLPNHKLYISYGHKIFGEAEVIHKVFIHVISYISIKLTIKNTQEINKNGLRIVYKYVQYLKVFGASSQRAEGHSGDASLYTPGMFLLKYTASQVELRMRLIVTCVDVKLNNQPDVFPKSSCYHPYNMRLIFCLEMIITHISYGHHFITLIFFLFLTLSQQSVQNHKMLYIIILISSLFWLSKHCDCIIAKSQFATNLRKIYSPKIRLNLCTTYNQHTTGISSVYHQVQRKHLHASAMETSLVKFKCNYFKMKLNKTKSLRKVKGVCYFILFFNCILLSSNSQRKDWSSCVITFLHCIAQKWVSCDLGGCGWFFSEEWKFSLSSISVVENHSIFNLEYNSNKTEPIQTSSIVNGFSSCLVFLNTITASERPFSLKFYNPNFPYLEKLTGSSNKYIILKGSNIILNVNTKIIQPDQGGDTGIMKEVCASPFHQRIQSYGNLIDQCVRHNYDQIKCLFVHPTSPNIILCISPIEKLIQMMVINSSIVFILFLEYAEIRVVMCCFMWANYTENIYNVQHESSCGKLLDGLYLIQTCSSPFKFPNMASTPSSLCLSVFYQCSQLKLLWATLTDGSEWVNQEMSHIIIANLQPNNSKSSSGNSLSNVKNQGKKFFLRQTEVREEDGFLNNQKGNIELERRMKFYLIPETCFLLTKKKESQKQRQHVHIAFTLGLVSMKNKPFVSLRDNSPDYSTHVNYMKCVCSSSVVVLLFLLVQLSLQPFLRFLKKKREFYILQGPLLLLHHPPTTQGHYQLSVILLLLYSSHFSSSLGFISETTLTADLFLSFSLSFSLVFQPWPQVLSHLMGAINHTAYSERKNNKNKNHYIFINCLLWHRLTAAAVTDKRKMMLEFIMNVLLGRDEDLLDFQKKRQNLGFKPAIEIEMIQSQKNRRVSDNAQKQLTPTQPCYDASCFQPIYTEWSKLSRYVERAGRLKKGI